MREPLSVASAGSFLVVAILALVLGQPILAVALTLLAGGTAAYHLFVVRAVEQRVGTIGHWAAKVDYAGMLATMVMLAAMPLPYGPQVLALGVGLALTPLYSHRLVTALAAVIVISLLLAGTGWYWVVGALALFGPAYWVWHRPGDLAHALWHVGSAAAFAVLVIGST